MINQKHLKEIDGIVLAAVLILSLIGLLFIYSASYYLPGNFFTRQLIWLLVSLIALIIVISIDYRRLLLFSLPFFILTNFLLLITLFFSRRIAGTRGWLDLFSFRLQPAELAKFSLILLLAYYFSEYRQEKLTLQVIVSSCGLAAIPLFLVMLQPDLGTAACFLPILLAALFLAGLSRRALAWMLIIAVIAGTASWHFYLKDYQKKRLITVIAPSQDKRGAGYHLLQSKIAIGSGGLIGKGFKKGTQSQLRFLPARHTDFIMAVIAEEAGYLGSLTVIGLFAWLIWRLLKSIELAKDRAGKYLIFMIAMLIAVEAIINISMVIGFFPVIGIPLPFVSYGGSSLLAHYLAIGLAINVRMRRFTYA
ncbi:MAG: rod shape-determining protein RodA [Candidatus Aminicenantes bacterium]|nr:rod shape-determining protein RodA [Candidatus Aminicenantes bacterium]